MNPRSRDYDGDGLPNYLDRDSDNDGIGDFCELEATTSSSITTTTPTTTTTIPTPIPTTTSSSSSTTTTIKMCAVERIYNENSEEIGLIRYFRNNVLSQTPEGQEVIRLYYQWSPVIVKLMEEDEEFREEVKEMIEEILPLIRGEAG